ncbi:hypothetical protein HY498_02790 [Candidatus Woesearchaeota archaeon]|nr:hypothetical protein [Candidatus Woesearchaeota archaeon]
MQQLDDLYYELRKRQSYVVEKSRKTIDRVIGFIVSHSIPIALEEIVSTTKNCNLELILPCNPIWNASYVLAFENGYPKKMEYALLFRVLHTCQSFIGLKDHKNFKGICNDLRRLYDNSKKIQVKIPRGHISNDRLYVDRELDALNLSVIMPNNHFLLAEEIEGVIANYPEAIKML